MIDDGPVNVRIYTDADGKAKRQSFLSLCVALVTLTLYCGWMHIMIGLLVGSFFSRWALLVLVLLLSTLLLPAKPVLWTGFCASPVFKTWREYFSYSYLAEEILSSRDENDPSKPKSYIFVEFPHGAIPLSELISGTVCQSIWPHFPIYSLAADSVFHIPLWRHIIAWLGARPATRHNFVRLLKRGSVAVLVGGIAEMFMQDSRRERLMLRSRKGFTRVAVETGTPIIPVYHFGNTSVFDFGPAFLMPHARRMGAALGVLIGRWGLPVPRRVPLMMVSGKPVEVEKVARDDPRFAAVVDEAHARVVKALQDLYERNRATYDPSWADRPLSIE